MSTIPETGDGSQVFACATVPWDEALVASKQRRVAPAAGNTWRYHEAQREASYGHVYGLVLTEHDAIRCDNPEDAKRIVAAVNAHDALLAACKDVLVSHIGNHPECQILPDPGSASRARPSRRREDRMNMSHIYWTEVFAGLAFLALAATVMFLAPWALWIWGPR